MNVKYVIWLLIILLVVLHQDVWFRSDGRLVLGFLPVGLAYHMGLTIAASVAWWLATLMIWPEDSHMAPDDDAEGIEP